VWGCPSSRDWIGGRQRKPNDEGRLDLFNMMGLREWQPNARTALATSALFVYAILSLQGKSEFIYLRF
jgi:hypothetical protein